MATWTQGTGTGGQLQLNVVEESADAGSNTSQVHVSALIYTPAGSFHSNADLTVSLTGGISWSTGSWSFTSAGGWHTLYDGVVTVGHNADGTGSFGVTFTLNSATSTSGVGGPAAVGGTIGLTTLTVLPGVPTGVTAVRASDAQMNLSWTNHYPSNGVPTTTALAQSVNGAALQQVITTGNVSSAALATVPNRKTSYAVQQANGAGASGWSALSAPVWTTPAAPTSCAASKQPDGSVLVSWANNVAYAEYGTEVWHGVVAGGVTTWDAAPLATAASGATSYSHTGPSLTEIHVYQVRAVTTSGAALYSTYAASNSVQLAAPPNAPTVATLPQYADKTKALAVNWTHNPVDSTAQTAYELSRSTDGGTTWTTTGKTASAAASFTVAGSTYSANAAVMFRVRTWGQANAGGSDGTGASPWSVPQTVTFKTAPTLTITSPTSGTGLAQAHTSVDLAFTQAEGATFVSGTVTLLQGATILETVNTSTAAGIPLATRLNDGGTYTLDATVTDSNGLTASAAPVTFAVNYADPSPATVTATYVPESGVAQLALAFPPPTGSQVEAATFTITRTINGQTEMVVNRQAIAGALTMIDTTPTINGTNTYSVTTYSADGAASIPVTTDMVTAEGRWAFLSTGDGFATIVKFYGNLSVASAPSRDAALVVAAGRSRPIALFGESATLDVSATATVLADEGSTYEDIETFLLTARRVCFRDPTGRRVLGAASGSLANRTPYAADLSLKVSEAQ